MSQTQKKRPCRNCRGQRGRGTEPVNAEPSETDLCFRKMHSVPGGLMDEERFRRMRQKVQAELVGCVKLSSLPLSKKVSKEIVEDRIRLFEFFRSQGLEKQVELNETLLRLLMNYVKMASYHGVLKGFKIEEQAAKLRKDKARYHLSRVPPETTKCNIQATRPPSG